MRQGTWQGNEDFVSFGNGRKHRFMNLESSGNSKRSGVGRRFANSENFEGNGGRGRNLGGGFGIGGFCVCAKCGEKIPHQRGMKCTAVKCPNCGHTMVREELLNKKKEN